jgi:Fis1 C-terminal tetratricopeptide repeat
MGSSEESHAGSPGGGREVTPRRADSYARISFLMYHHPAVEIYRAEPTRRRECLYYLSLGYYKMENFEEAKKFNGMCIYVSTAYH